MDIELKWIKPIEQLPPLFLNLNGAEEKDEFWDFATIETHNVLIWWEDDNGRYHRDIGYFENDCCCAFAYSSEEKPLCKIDHVKGWVPIPWE